MKPAFCIGPLFDLCWPKSAIIPISSRSYFSAVSSEEKNLRKSITVMTEQVHIQTRYHPNTNQVHYCCANLSHGLVMVCRTLLDILHAITDMKFLSTK
jgi:hypothetical protein